MFLLVRPMCTALAGALARPAALPPFPDRREHGSAAGRNPGGGDTGRGPRIPPNGGGGCGMTAECFRSDGAADDFEPPPPTGLLDVLSVAATVVDADGRIVF